MAESKQPFSEEMISGYLDGKLSPEQRQMVERVLQENAHQRQLYEQLRSVRELLQGLPQHELDTDFSARVLARINDLASDDGVRLAGKPARSGDDHAPWPSRGVRRGLFWAAMTLATAVALLIVYSPDGRNGRQLARVPNADNTAEVREAIEPPLQSSFEESESSEVGKVVTPLDRSSTNIADDAYRGEEVQPRSEASIELQYDASSADSAAVPSLAVPGQASSRFNSPAQPSGGQAGALAEQSPPSAESGPVTDTEELAPSPESALGHVEGRSLAESPGYQTLRVDVTTPEQIRQVITQLRTDQLTILEQLAPVERKSLQIEERQWTLDNKSSLGMEVDLRRATSESELAGIVVQGSVQQIVDSLSRADLQVTQWNGVAELARYKEYLYEPAEEAGRAAAAPQRPAAAVQQANGKALSDKMRPLGNGVDTSATEFSADRARLKQMQPTGQSPQAGARGPETGFQELDLSARPSAPSERVVLFFRLIEASSTAPAADADTRD
jgi:hypothetical protein